MERLLIARVPSSESIGACSLDVDASESSAVLAARARPMGKEASEITLRSTAVSAITSHEGGTTQQARAGVGGTLDGNVAQLSNGCWNIGGSSIDQWSSTKLVEHRPSYLGISCAINGYTNYSQFCRSRDNSPARLSPRTLGPLVTSPGSNSAKVEPIPEGKANGRELSNGRHHHAQGAASAAGPSTSLVQQRILALYGSEAAERVARSRTRTAKSPLKLEVVSKRSPSCPAQVVRGRSKSPPVFRHLTRHFKEHLRLSEVSASQTENLPGFVPGGRSLLLGSPEKRLPSSVALRAASEGDRGDNGVLTEEDSLKRSLHCQVVNGGGALKLNGSHGLLMAVDEVDKAHVPVRTAPAPQPPAAVCTTKALSSSDLPMREGHAFLATLCSTQETLESRIREAQRDLDDAAVPEDSKGQIRATIGKANLLITQKFKQFRELCHKNIEQNVDDSFPTTGSDLAGFWDMVMLQVENVHALFEELNALRANNWEELKKTGSTRVAALRPAKKTVASRSVPASPKRSEKAEEAARSRLEARKRLMEAKRQARQSQAAATARDNEDIAIFVPQEKN